MMTPQVNKASGSAPSLVRAARKSSRTSKTNASNMMDKAMKLRASKTLQGITSKPVTHSMSSFRVLALAANSHLLKVAADSNIILGSSTTLALDLIDSFRAKEEAQAAIAEATVRQDLVRTMQAELRAVADDSAREGAESSSRATARRGWGRGRGRGRGRQGAGRALNTLDGAGARSPSVPQ